MGDCKYCGQAAGFLRNKHSECEKKYEEGRSQIVALIPQAISSSVSLEVLPQQLKQVMQRSFISDIEKRELLLQSWEFAVDRCLEDGILDESEEKLLLELKDRFSLSQSDLDRAGAFSRVVKAAVLRDVLNGIVPQRVTIDGNLPINFQKGEQIVWTFPNAEYLEDKTRRQYVGGSRGVSIRIMKGMYYRIGAFKGQAVNRTERVYVDKGWVVVTNKHIYFAGSVKSLRIPYSKIVSFQSFSDGIGVLRDAANAKPQIFVTGDGWFTYNLVSNLAKL